MSDMKAPANESTNYVVQIVSIGIRPDNVHEARMLLAPEVDLSSIRITVKGNTLRASVESCARSSGTLGDVARRIVKHRENLLVPETIDGDLVRAVVDNERRMLIVTAPGMQTFEPRKRNDGRCEN